MLSLVSVVIAGGRLRQRQLHQSWSPIQYARRTLLLEVRAMKQVVQYGRPCCRAAMLAYLDLGSAIYRLAIGHDGKGTRSGKSSGLATWAVVRVE